MDRCLCVWADLEVQRNQDGKTAMQMYRERVAAEMAKFKQPPKR